VRKKSINNSQPFVKKMSKMSGPSGGIFLTHTVYPEHILHDGTETPRTLHNAQMSTELHAKKILKRDHENALILCGL